MTEKNNGRLYKEIWKALNEINPNQTNAYPIGVFKKILGEAAKEFPLKEEQYKKDYDEGKTSVTDTWTLDPDEIMAWFEKWFGTLENKGNVSSNRHES